MPLGQLAASRHAGPARKRRTHAHPPAHPQPHSGTCLMKISRSRDCPKGLYLRLNLSNLGCGEGWNGGTDVDGLFLGRRRGAAAAARERRRRAPVRTPTPPRVAPLPRCPPSPAHAPVEDVFVGVHVQGVDVEVVGREVERLKHFAQRQVLAVPVGRRVRTGGGRGECRRVREVGGGSGGRAWGTQRAASQGLVLGCHGLPSPRAAKQAPHSTADTKQQSQHSAAPHLKITTSSGSLRSLLLMKRSKCFWCMHALRAGDGRAPWRRHGSAWRRHGLHAGQRHARRAHLKHARSPHLMNPPAFLSSSKTKQPRPMQQQQLQQPRPTCGARVCPPCARCKSRGAARSSAPGTPCLRRGRAGRAAGAAGPAGISTCGITAALGPVHTVPPSTTNAQPCTPCASTDRPSTAPIPPLPMRATAAHPR